jgi:hypothetical protein
MAGINYENIPCHRLIVAFKASAAVADQQLVVFGGDDETVSPTTAASSELIIGKATHAMTSADVTNGERLDVELLGSKVIWMVAGGTVTRGTVQECQGTDGKITNAGATPDPGALVGRAMRSGVSGDKLPVLV